MTNRILGLHHITAIANGAKRNFDFYTKGMGLRMVKKTVNFDDPTTYHFYYGNEGGEPGTILTFFPWEGIGKGYAGVGQATEIGYSVPGGSYEFWQERLSQLQAPTESITERFGETVLPFTDPDGLNLSLIVQKTEDSRVSWQTPEVAAAVATKGFHSVTLTLRKIDATAKILTDIFGYTLQAQEGNRYRFVTDAVPEAAIIDILEQPTGVAGRGAGGTNHHIAFRVKDEVAQAEFREKIMSHDLQITPKIDRDYFYSLYFREPGGVLFEIATYNPGFTVDEPLAELGQHLQLPKQYEPSRNKIEKALPVIK